MARAARFNISAIADLLEQLRYAPPERRHHDMVAAEAFLNELDENQNYPEDFVVFRITDYRPEIVEPSLLVGHALCGDLAIFIERLSLSLNLDHTAFAPRVALSLAATLDRLSVSNSTLRRYRKLGLVAHQIVWPDGKQRLGFFEDAIANFEDRHASRVRKARGFAHLGAAEKLRMIRRAQRYQATLDYSMQQITQRLSKKFNRSDEAVRQLLKRHDARNPAAAIFKSRPELGANERNILLRADSFGIPMSHLAIRFERTRPTLYRAIHQAKAVRIQSWEINYVELPTFKIAEAADFLLSSDLVRHGFARNGYAGYFGGTSAADWVAQCEQVDLEIDEAAETAWFGALNYLLAQAVQERLQFDRHHASAKSIDAIETNLRWAVALKERIMAANLRSILATLEIHLGHHFLAATSAEVVTLHHLGIKILARSVDQFNPARGQRFGALLSLNLRRALASLPSTRNTSTSTSTQTGKARAKRIGPRHQHLVLAGSRTVTQYPWQEPLAFSAQRAALIALLCESQAEDTNIGTISNRIANEKSLHRFEILTARYGLNGNCPLTCFAVAEQFGITPEQVAATESRAIRQLRQMGYAQMQQPE